MAIRGIDLFSGAGGSSAGARAAGIELVAAFDRWNLARRVYRDNFPGVQTFGGDLGRRKLSALSQHLGRIDLMLASPECTSHSVARGGRPRDEESRGTAFHVTRFAQAISPRWI